MGMGALASYVAEAKEVLAGTTAMGAADSVAGAEASARHVAIKSSATATASCALPTPPEPAKAHVAPTARGPKSAKSTG